MVNRQQRRGNFLVPDLPEWPGRRSQQLTARRLLTWPGVPLGLPAAGRGLAPVALSDVPLARSCVILAVGRTHMLCLWEGWPERNAGRQTAARQARARGCSAAGQRENTGRWQLRCKGIAARDAAATGPHG